MVKREKCCDAGPHGITHDVGAINSKMIEQRKHIARHEFRVVERRIVELDGGTVTAIVERDDAAAGALKRRQPARIDPVHLFVGREAVNEDDRVALALIEIGDLACSSNEASRRDCRNHPRTPTRAAQKHSRRRADFTSSSRPANDDDDNGRQSV